MALKATAAITHATTSPSSVQVSGTLGPAAVDSKAKVTLLARKKGSTGAFRAIGKQSPTAGQSVFAINGSLSTGSWTIEVQYADPGAFTTGTSARRNVTVPAASGPKLGYKKVAITDGVLTLTGTLSSAPKGSGGTVRLFARVLNKLAAKSATAAASKPAKFTPGRQGDGQGRHEDVHAPAQVQAWIPLRAAGQIHPHGPEDDQLEVPERVHTLTHVTLRRSRMRQDLPANRRPGVFPGRRFALALGLALALLGSAGVASADSGSVPMVTATIYASGGGTSSESISSSQLLADPQRCPAYSQTQMAQHGSSGTTSVGLPQEHGSGTGTWSLGTVLGCLQPKVSLGDVTGVTILNSDGSPQGSQGSQLTPADLATPSDFDPSTDSPVVSDLGSSFQYNRPWRGNGDENGPDQVTSSDPISIEVFQGPPLTVSATASRPTAAAGSSLSFSALVSGNQGSALTYDWSFGDNLPESHAAAPSVTYTDAGSYNVTLQVTDADGGGGGTTVPITVTGSSGTTPPPGTPSTPNANTGPHGTGTNPNGGTHGSPDGNGKGNGRQSSSGNGNHDGKPSQDQTGGLSPSSTHRQKPSGSGTGSTGGSGGSSGGSGAGGSASPSAPSPNSSAPRRPPGSGGHHATHTRPSSTSAQPGQLVTGRLVADVTPLSAGASPLVQRSPGSAATAPSPPRPSATSPLAVIGGGLAIVLLLGLGAGRELRGPGWWRPLRSST